jgi:hypothetical protein
MMLDWLGERHGVARLGEAAQHIDEAVEEGFATRTLRPMEFGGDQGLKAATQAVADVWREGSTFGAAELALTHWGHHAASIAKPNGTRPTAAPITLRYD